MLFNIYDLKFKSFFSESNRNNITKLHIVGSLTYFPVHLYMGIIASIIGNGSPFYQEIFPIALSSMAWMAATTIS